MTFVRLQANVVSAVCIYADSGTFVHAFDTDSVGCGSVHGRLE